MKVMRVVLTPLIYQFHYEKPLTYTMFPAWNTPLSTQQALHLAV